MHAVAYGAKFRKTTFQALNSKTNCAQLFESIILLQILKVTDYFFPQSKKTSVYLKLQWSTIYSVYCIGEAVCFWVMN
jgi:hypothetical protein